jgi:hypothetical protein
MCTAGDYAESARKDGAAIAPIWQMKRILGSVAVQVNELHSDWKKRGCTRA